MLIKYLGILVDSSLSGKQQVSNVSKKISRSIGIMYKLRPYLPLNVMKSIYYSLVYSHLIYAIEVWGAAFKTELNKLVVLQKRAVRLMTYKDNFPLHPGPLSHTEHIFHNLMILKIEDIYKFQVCKFIFKTIKKTPMQFHDWFIFTSVQHNYRTMSNYKEILKMM